MKHKYLIIKFRDIVEQYFIHPFVSKLEPLFGDETNNYRMSL